MQKNQGSRLTFCLGNLVDNCFPSPTSTSIFPTIQAKMCIDWAKPQSPIGKYIVPRFSQDEEVKFQVYQF